MECLFSTIPSQFDRQYSHTNLFFHFPCPGLQLVFASSPASCYYSGSSSSNKGTVAAKAQANTAQVWFQICQRLKRLFHALGYRCVKKHHPTTTSIDSSHCISRCPLLALATCTPTGAQLVAVYASASIPFLSYSCRGFCSKPSLLLAEA